MAAGFVFRVMSNGSRTWIMRITIRGVRRDISIGPLATLSLAKAREKAHNIRKAVSEGVIRRQTISLRLRSSDLRF
jgi:hypothetical protein